MKIKILLIDDKPFDPINIGSELNIPNFDIENFEIKWLKTTADIKNYRDFFVWLEKYHFDFLNEYIPDIIIIDYTLTIGNDTSFINRLYSSNNDLLSIYPFGDILKKINNHDSERWKKIFLNTQTYELEYAKEKAIKNEILEDKDTLGCFGGILISLLFKNSPTTSLALTYKDDEATIGTYAGFVEWLVKEDLPDFSKHKALPVEQKNWESVLNTGCFQLRNSITLSASKGEIHLSYNNLKGILYYGGNTNYLTFKTKYGKRDLLLEGLFFDVPIEKKQSKINEFIKELLNIFLLKLGGNIEEKEIDNAFKLVDILFNAIEDRIFSKRYYLSWLHAKKRKRDKVTLLDEQKNDFDETELNDYTRILKQFGANTGKSTDIYKIDKIFVTELREFENETILTQRLVVFFSVIKLLNRYEISKSKYLKMKNVDKDSFLLKEPTIDDLMYCLFPVPRSPLALYVHERIGNDEHREFLKKLLNIKDLPNNLDFSNTFHNGEIDLILDYAKTKEKMKQLPKWLLI